MDAGGGPATLRAVDRLGLRLAGGGGEAAERRALGTGPRCGLWESEARVPLVVCLFRQSGIHLVVSALEWLMTSDLDRRCFFSIGSHQHQRGEFTTYYHHIYAMLTQGCLYI